MKNKREQGALRIEVRGRRVRKDERGLEPQPSFVESVVKLFDPVVLMLLNPSKLTD
jgi:hypothetical protein